MALSSSNSGSVSEAANAALLSSPSFSSPRGFVTYLTYQHTRITMCSRMVEKPGILTRPSALCTMHAKKAVLYCRSRTPRLFKPVTPLPPTAPLPPGPPFASRIISALTPGNPNWLTSGTTQNVPVNTHRSPALARSTISPRRITSRLRGILPVGISEGFS